jgi:RNA-directed DNA polymerase
MEKVLSRPNLEAALKRVTKNKGSPGIDGMTTEDLLPYLWENWHRIRGELLAGTYQPSPVKRQEIPKRWRGLGSLADAAPMPR